MNHKSSFFQFILAFSTRWIANHSLAFSYSVCGFLICQNFKKIYLELNEKIKVTLL